MQKLNKLMKIGLAIIPIMLLLKNLSIQLPDYLQGLFLGIGIGFELIGIYSINHDISKFKNYKMNLLKKYFNR